VGFFRADNSPSLRPSDSIQRNALVLEIQADDHIIDGVVFCVSKQLFVFREIHSGSVVCHCFCAQSVHYLRQELVLGLDEVERCCGRWRNLQMETGIGGLQPQPPRAFWWTLSSWSSERRSPSDIRSCLPAGNVTVEGSSTPRGGISIYRKIQARVLVPECVGWDLSRASARMQAGNHSPPGTRSAGGPGLPCLGYQLRPRPLMAEVPDQ